jgi:hypothetical protein
MTSRTRRETATRLGSLVVLLAACSDSAGIEPGRGVTLTVVADPAPAQGEPGSVEIGDVRLVLGGIKLESAGVDGTVDWQHTESSVLVLDLTGQPVTAEAYLDIPAGTYKEIEISIDKLEPGKPSESGLLADHPDLADASIIISGLVRGSSGGVPYSFAAALDRDMEILLQPLFVLLDESTASVRVTLAVDPAGWFRGPTGQWLDPRDPANRSAIESNIQASLAAFEDGNMDGVPGPVAR